MRVLDRDMKHGRVKVACETMDDLWHLYNLVGKGDVVGAFTARREEGGDDKLRPDKGVKRKMFLAVRVESVEFHEFSDRLRVLGTIVQAPEDVVGHHTFNLESDSVVEITKDTWPRHHLDRLDEAVKNSKRPLLLVLAIEDDSAVLGVMHHYGIRVAAQLVGHSPGKQYKDSGAKSDFFERVLEALRQERKSGMPLAVIGPGFAKEEFLKFCRERGPEIAKGAVVDSTAQAGLTGIHEALKSGAITKAMGEQRVATEMRAVEDLLSGIAKNGPVTYGPAQVRHALEQGAVARLLVTDTMVRSGAAEGFLEPCRGQGGECLIVSTSHDGGKKLDGLGGIAAILRYRI